VQELQVKVTMVVMVRVVAAVVLLAVAVLVLLVVVVLQVAPMNVVVMAAQEYHLHFQEHPQHMVVVVVESRRIMVLMVVGEMVELMVVRLVHLAVVVMLHLEILALVSTLTQTLVVAVEVVVTVVEIMQDKVVRVLLLSNGNMNSWQNLKHESNSKNTAYAV